MNKKILFFFLLITITIGAQNKKELEDQLLKLNTDIETLKTELGAAKIQLQQFSDKANEYSIKLEDCRTKYEACTDDKLKMMTRQNELIAQNQKLQLQIDSLKAAAQVVSSGLITNPQNKEDSIRMTIQKYLLTASVAERMQYVISNDKTANRMQSYYSQGMKPKEIKSSEITFGNQVGEYFVVFSNNSKYYVKTVGGKYLINWESSVGFNDVNLTAYKASRGSSVEVKVRAKLSDYYNYNYRDKEAQYISVSIVDNIGGYVHGYVSRNSTLGKNLMNILSDGMEHQIIIQITADRSDDTSGELNIITKLVSESWLKD
jgi:hypothetical protein